VLDKAEFAKAVEDCKTLCAAIPVPLAGWQGKGKPKFGKTEIAFNGVEACGHVDTDLGIAWPTPDAKGIAGDDKGAISPENWFAGAQLTGRACGGDCSHESFVVPQSHKPYAEWDEPDENGRYFSFCKTAFKPYDLSVQACLIVLACRFPGKFLVSSNGDWENWVEATEFVQARLGYGREIKALAFASGKGE